MALPLKFLAACLFALVVTSYTNLAIANTQIAKCQHVKTELETVKKARRKGGSGRYMSYLRKEKKRLDRRYSDLRCYQVRTDLK